MPRASNTAIVSHVVLVLVATGAALAAGFMLGAFSAPHAFGGRDGQGAAGLAALILVGSGGVAIVATLGALLAGRALVRREVPWARKIVWVPVAVGVLAYLAFALRIVH